MNTPTALGATVGLATGFVCASSGLIDCGRLVRREDAR
jgi:hypothetical protein